MQPGVFQITYLKDPVTGEKTIYDSCRVAPRVVDGANRCSQSIVLSGNKTLYVDVLEEGESIYGTTRIPFDAGSGQEYYYRIVNAMTDVIKGENLNVTVRVEPIDGHVSKNVVNVVVQKGV